MLGPPPHALGLLAPLRSGSWDREFREYITCWEVGLGFGSGSSGDAKKGGWVEQEEMGGTIQETECSTRDSDQSRIRETDRNLDRH